MQPDEREHKTLEILMCDSTQYNEIYLVSFGNICHLNEIVEAAKAVRVPRLVDVNQTADLAGGEANVLVAWYVINVITKLLLQLTSGDIWSLFMKGSSTTVKNANTKQHKREI